MRRWRLLPAAVLLAILVPVRVSLAGPTEKPLPSQKPSQKPESDFDDFNLEDALNPGGFDDSDLIDSNLPRGGEGAGGGGGAGGVGGGGDGSGSNEPKGPSQNNAGESEGSQGAIAGIVSAVFATVIGAVSSFIAYQKKKLCFKQSADEENVNMDSHRGAQSEPPVQRTLLEN